MASIRPRLPLWLVILGLALLLSPRAGQARAYQDLIEQGKQLYRQTRCAEATERFEEAARLRPSSIALCGLALSLHCQQRWAESLHSARQCLAEAREASEAQLRSVNEVARLSEVNLHYERGKELLAGKQCFDAEAEFRRALALAQEARSVCRLAQSLRCQERWAEAVEQYDRCLERSRMEADASISPGELARLQTERDEAQGKIVVPPPLPAVHQRQAEHQQRAGKLPLIPAGGTPPPPPRAAKPLHRRWWFWTIVGGVAAAGAVTAAVLATRPQEPMPTTPPTPPCPVEPCIPAMGM